MFLPGGNAEILTELGRKFISGGFKVGVENLFHPNAVIASDMVGPLSTFNDLLETEQSWGLPPSQGK